MSDYTPDSLNRAADTLPVIVLDDAVVLPHMVVSLPLDDDTAPAAEAARQAARRVLLVARREDADAQAPLALQLHRVGVVARIEQTGTLPDGTSGVVVRGLVRARLGEQTQFTPYPRFAYTEQPDVVVATPEWEALTTEVRAAIDAVLNLRPNVPQELRNWVRNIQDPGQLADTTGYAPEYTVAERQELLETFDIGARLRKVLDWYRKQITILEVQAKLRQEVQDGAGKQQREFFLRQQLRAIQKELGEDDDDAEGLDDLRTKLAEADLPEATRKEADRELARLQRMGGQSPEYQMVRTYLEWLAELPWNKQTGSAIDVAHARTILNEDHFGLE